MKAQKDIDKIMTIQNVKQFFMDQIHMTPHNQKSCIRVPQKLAKQMLLDNETIIIGGKVRGFNIIHIGMGIYEVTLNDLTSTWYAGDIEKN